MDTNLEPLVSIQMCTFNRANFIDKAIQSVLNQSYKNWELLILDDCSTDDTQIVVNKYLSDERIKYIKNSENIGITKNRNRCLEYSIGKYTAILDSDDFWINTDKLKEQVNFLENYIDYALVGTNFLIQNLVNKSIKKVYCINSNFFIHKTLLLKNHFCHSSVLYRNNVVREFGGYSEEIKIWEDYDLWLKISSKFKVANLKLFSTNYTKHSNQSNSEFKKESIDVQKIIINKYKKSYNFYYLALLLNFIRRIRS